MKIVIVGGAGYLGSHVTRYLAPQSHVTVLDALLYRDEFHEPVKFIRGDVTEPLKTALACKYADVVIWLAAIVGDGACAVNPALSHKVNVEAVQNLVDIYHGPLIFTSTASVYGFYDGVANEDSPFNPQSLYAEQKVKAEEILANRPDTLILRLATLHGPSPRLRFDLVVNVMTRDAVTKNLITVHGGHQWRPLASVHDVAHFIYCMALKTPMMTGVYNVVSQNLQIMDVADIIHGVTGAGQNIIPTNVEDRRDYRLDGERLSGVYRPVITVEDSATDLARMLREGRIVNPYADRYVNSKVIQGRILE